MERTPKRDFLFVDETGDPGRDLLGGSSKYFAVGCVHVTDISLEQLHRHLFALGYFSGHVRELKSSRLSRLQKDQIADIAKWLCESQDTRLTVVFIDKDRYVGPYFGISGERPYDAVRFRNFLTRQLLEHHFDGWKPVSSECDLVFDRAIGEAEEVNVRQYLRGNFRLPQFTSIVHCDSRFVPALQFADSIVHIVKECVFGNRESVDERLLGCMKVIDVSTPRSPR